MKDYRVNTRLLYIDLAFDLIMGRLKEKYLEKIKLDSGPPRICKYHEESGFEIFLQEASKQSVTLYLRGEKEKAVDILNYIKDGVSDWDKFVTSDKSNYES